MPNSNIKEAIDSIVSPKKHQFFKMDIYEIMKNRKLNKS